jgi:HAD superfamily hydrolase (TIGR01490 family)
MTAIVSHARPPSVLLRGTAADDPLEPPQASATQAVTIIDLDRTITRRGTYSPFLLFSARRLAPWRLALIPAVLLSMAAYKLRLIPRRALKQTMHRLMLGRSLGRQEAIGLADAYADHVLAANLNSAAATLIATEQAQGRRIILATAAHRLYAEAIARKLGIDDVVATESVWRDAALMPEIDGENCRGLEKARRVRAYLDALGLDRSRISVRCYSDDASDLPCFEFADEPVAVNPTRKLSRLAQAKHWPILALR